jgi:hypothetical protein
MAGQLIQPRASDSRHALTKKVVLLLDRYIEFRDCGGDRLRWAATVPRYSVRGPIANF